MKITVYELIILIHDNKAPIKIKIDNIIFYFDKNYSSIERMYINSYETDWFGALDIKLNTIVEILPEENDEWEDIKEINHNGKQIYNPKTSSYNTLNSKEKNIFIPVINQLIKNQKYIKEKLESKDVL